MNFVIVGRLFYPQRDPESYCTTRFASALAKAGHVVHVITREQPKERYLNSYPQLVNSRIKVTVFKTPIRYQVHLLSLRWMCVEEPLEAEISPFIDEVKRVLRTYDAPILITRSYPWISLYIGWYCRKHAYKWVHHFSDPMLDFGAATKRLYLSKWLKKIWMRRAMRHADAISVTCKRVRWYYREQLGPCVDKAKFILATHIGDFKLDKKGEEVGGGGEGCGDGGGKSSVRCPPNFSTASLIFHDGDIYGGRGLMMVDAVNRLNAGGFACTFLQGRDIENEGDRARILASPFCKIVGKDAPLELKELAKSAQVSFVADFDMPGVPYSTHLMSKFVYQLFTDRPMVVLSKIESEKHDYCVAYPEAGLFFAEIGKVESLMAAVKAAFACDPKSIDRTSIRERFSEEHIAAEFIEQLKCEDLELLKDKWMGRV